MTTVLLNSQFHTENCRRLLDDIQYQRTNYFYFLGKTIPWSETDTVPTTISDTVNTEYETRSEIVALNKISPSDISFVVPRINWTSGTLYTQYDSGIELQDTNFYVLNSEFNVYKCISNNRGAVSTTQPTGISYSNIQTADAYIWKYMYTIPQAKRSKFLSSSMMPVQTAVSDRFYNNGSVDTVVIESGGTGYTDVLETYITFTDTTGSGAVYIPKIVSGSIIGFTRVSGGSNYSSSVSINLINTPGTGHGKYGNATAVLVPKVIGGQITDIIIQDPGIDYTNNRSTTLTITGDGSGAEFSPVIYNGSIVDVVCINPGTGYSYVNYPVVLSGGTGTGAVLSAKLGNSDFISDQSVVEQTASTGAIYNIVPLTTGSDYTQYTNVNIFGDGTGATCTAVIVNGAITGYNIVNSGSGYTYAYLYIQPTNIAVNPGASLATARVVIQPGAGHGTDAISELHADTLCVYTNFRYTPDTILVNQDFRQSGIIKSLKDDSGNVFSLLNSLCCYTGTFDTTSGMVKDEILQYVVNTTKIEVRVVEVGSGTAILTKLSPNEIPAGSTLQAKNQTSRTYVLNSLVSTNVSNITADKFSGSLLYTSDTDQFSFNADQEITIRTYLKL